MKDLVLWQIVFVSNHERSCFNKDSWDYQNFLENELEIFELPITTIQLMEKDWVEKVQVCLWKKFTYVDVENLYHTKEDCIAWALEYKRKVLERMKSNIDKMLE